MREGIKTYIIYKVEYNMDRMDDKVYTPVFETECELDENKSFDLNNFLNDEISKDGHGVFGDSDFIEVRNIHGHTIKKVSVIPSSLQIQKFENMMEN